MARPSIDYTLRGPAKSVLRPIVQQHLETFPVEAVQVRDGQGLPRFVEEQFRAFLGCGWLAGGFARFHCGGCGACKMSPQAGTIVAGDSAQRTPCHAVCHALAWRRGEIDGLRREVT